VIAAKCGLAGSLTIGDNVALGAMVGLNNHITIGDGAQVAAMAGVKDSIPPRARWGGIFARPTKQWFREILAVEKLARESMPGTDATTQDTKDEGRE
jgi:UDP-3-O-[3-hydroxymyristoyl] glucosamine N-acyltransferase